MDSIDADNQTNKLASKSVSENKTAKSTKNITKSSSDNKPPRYVFPGGW